MPSLLVNPMRVEKCKEFALLDERILRWLAEPTASSAESAGKSFDDVVVATAATGDKIPHLLSKKAKTIFYLGKRVEIPEGFVYVPPGEFLMGEGANPPEGPEHKVWLDGFCIGKYEVTNAEWKAFTDATGFTPLPSHWKGGQIPEGKENHPVVNVSWEDAKAYCEWVSKETGREVRLPTEAQWEKAASWDPRKRQKHTYPWGNDWNPRNCNWQGACALKYGLKVTSDGTVPEWDAFAKTEKYKEMANAGGYTTPVGSFAKDKSPWGCYDMAGNAYEWCSDWFHSEYYKAKGVKKNPEGPSEEEAEVCDFSGKKYKARVLRGGSWYVNSGICRAVNRGRLYPSGRGVCDFGFRVAVCGAR